MIELIFEHLKPYAINTGSVVTMKALITVHGKQFIEVYENSTLYKPIELTAVNYDKEELSTSND